MLTLIEIKKFEIKTKKDVKKFFEYLINDLRVNFHPDDSFRDTVEIETDNRVFDDEAADYLDDKMTECFSVADEEIYDIGCKVLDAFMSK